MIWALGALAVFGATPPENSILSKLSPQEYSAAAMPFFLGQRVPPILAGVLLAGMLAATMSTDSSYLLSWASVITLDVIAPGRKKKISPKNLILMIRIFVVLIALFVFCWGVLWRPPTTILTYLFLTGAMYTSGAAALMIAGLYWRKASSFGAHLALLAGITLPILNIFIKQLVGPENYPISDSVAGFGSFVLAGLGIVVGSLLKPADFDLTFKEEVAKL